MGCPVQELAAQARAKVEATYEIDRKEHEDTHSARALLCGWFISTYDCATNRENPAQIGPGIIAARTGL
jgi:hypothetical protein